LAAEAPVPLGDLPALHAARDPDRAALTFEGMTLSRAELEARASRRARQLAAAGVQPDDMVSLILPNGLAFYETTFAIWKLGATPNPIPLKAPPAERDAILEVSRPRLVVASEDLALGEGLPVIRGDLSPSADFSADAFPASVAKYWKAMGSGGSTGRPKLIVDHMPAAREPGMPTLGIEVEDVVLNPGPLHHNAPFIVAHTTLFLGGHLIEAGRFDPVQTLELIERHRVRWMCLVPTMMHRIWRLGPEIRNRYDLSSLRRILHMAAPCPAWLKEAWIDWLGQDRVWELYGGTERQGVTVISGEEWLAHRGSVGRIQPGAGLRILGETGEEVKPGEVGEVHFLPDAGPASTYHYLGAEPRRAGEWESIGDLGYLDDEGYLYLVDRRADLILSGGANIYPAEIEAALEAHPSVASSIAIGLPDEDLGQVVHAIVQPAPGGPSPSQAELLEFLAQRLSRNKLPRSFEFVDRPLRDDAGKARRSALREERLAKGS
jgi:bile acid-coenzyme A ligase